MQKNKGISLIVLVITIIVMIVLAGSIILSLSNNGIIGKANEAVDLTNEASVRQLVELKWAEAYLDENVKKTDAGMYNAVMAKLKEEKLDLTTYDIEVTAKGTTVEKIPTVEDLQSKYEFTYYKEFEKAIEDVNAGRIGTNADATRETAEAGIYQDNGKNYVVLLDNVEVEQTLNISEDMTLNLGGHKLYSSTNMFTIDNPNENKTVINLSVDGRLAGSIMALEDTVTSGVLTLMRIEAKGNAIIKGGKYIADAKSTSAVCPIVVVGKLEISNATLECKNVAESRAMNVNEAGTLLMKNCNLSTIEANNKCVTVYSAGNSMIDNCYIITETKSSSQDAFAIEGNGILAISNCNIQVEAEEYNSWGIHMRSPVTAKISGCNIDVKSKNNYAFGIALRNLTSNKTVEVFDCNIATLSENGLSGGVLNQTGDLTISNCNIKAQDIYYANARGIDNDTGGDTIVNNCVAWGTAIGIRNKGNIEINGGTYEGYIYGGARFFGENKTSYLRNATIKQCNRPEEYLGEKTSYDVGLHIGDLTDYEFVAKNITVNVDNCNISGLVNSIKLGGSTSNTLKISNSTIDTTKPIVIDDAMHKLYIGAGCNFNSANTNLESAVIVEPSAVYTK